LVECEMCGSPIVGGSFKVVVEGVTLTVCSRCYRRLTASKNVLPSKRDTVTVKPKPKPVKPKPRTSRFIREEYEVVEDYAKRVKKAREELGWTHAVLAQKVRESENVIRRIEAGKLIPTIDLARRLERVLKIKLLQPTIEPIPESYSEGGELELTLGDVANIRRRK